MILLKYFCSYNISKYVKLSQITSGIADTADIVDIIEVEIVGNDDTHPMSNLGFTLRYAHASENITILHSQVSPLALKLFHAMPTS